LVSMAIIGFVAFAVTLLLEYCRNWKISTENKKSEIFFEIEK
jgi:hypothetical protein